MSIQHAARAIAGWVQFYYTRRPHQALAMQTPAEAFKAAAYPEQIQLGQ
ncbi:integrase core domain-containing protein [Falsirhodobacter deserti]